MDGLDNGSKRRSSSEKSWKAMFPDLRQQLVFYGSYHHNPGNQLIHFIFVPMIYWSVAVWGTYTGPLIPTAPVDAPWNDLLVVNLAFIQVLFYVLYYLGLEFFAGLTWAVFIGFPVWITANAFRMWVERAWVYALVLHVLGWYAQIHLGHAILEKRRPALMDSLFQSFVSAPLFVWFELLFLLGYKKDLQRKLNIEIERNILEWKSAQNAAKGVSNNKSE